MLNNFDSDRQMNLFKDAFEPLGDSFMICTVSNTSPYIYIYMIFSNINLSSSLTVKN